MDFLKTLTNPVVIIGGVGLGLVLMLANKGGSTSNVGPTYSGITDAYNVAAMRSQQASLSAWVDVSKAKISAAVSTANSQLEHDAAISGNSVARYVATVDLLNNIQSTNSQVQKQSLISGAGVAQTLIQQSGAVAIDNTQQMIRLALGNTQAAVDTNSTNKLTTAQQNVAKVTANSNLNIAQANASASIVAAQEQGKSVRTAAKYNMYSNMFDTVGDVAKAVIPLML